MAFDLEYVFGLFEEQQSIHNDYASAILNEFAQLNVIGWICTSLQIPSGTVSNTQYLWNDVAQEFTVNFVVTMPANQMSVHLTNYLGVVQQTGTNIVTVTIGFNLPAQQWTPETVRLYIMSKLSPVDTLPEVDDTHKLSQTQIVEAMYHAKTTKGIIQ